MPYNKTVTFNEEQDEFIQQELQQWKNTAGICYEEQTSSVADQVLAILESAAETDVT